MHEGNGAHLELDHQPAWVEDDRHHHLKNLREICERSFGQASAQEKSTEQGRRRKKFDARDTV